jgi:hypothetical protein
MFLQLTKLNQNKNSLTKSGVVLPHWVGRKSVCLETDTEDRRRDHDETPFIRDAPERC